MSNRITYEKLKEQAEIWRNNLEQTYGINKVSDEDLTKLIARVWGYNKRTIDNYKVMLELENFIKREGLNWLIMPEKELVKGNETDDQYPELKKVLKDVPEPGLSADERKILEAGMS